MIVHDHEIKKYAAEGYEFTFDRPTSPVARWSTIDFAMESYMGPKLFLKNGIVKQANYLKGMRDKEGKVTAIEVRRA